MTGPFDQPDTQTAVVAGAAIRAAYTDLTETPPPGRSLCLPGINPSPAERYELFGQLARGGMGVVYRGRDRLLGREVVLKLLREDLAGCPASERRFLREARVNGQLQHPGIVPVYDVGRFGDGRPFLTMKYVHGQTLDALLATRTAADLPHLLLAFEQVCQTVAYAHAKGIVHRDLKPLNVMASRFGQVRVLDWGLAKVLTSREHEQPEDEDPETTGRYDRPDDSVEQTLAGAVAGTPAFMPPEQAAGDPRLDERADVFALGGILCGVLTGRPPYTGPDLATVWAKAKHADLTDAHTTLARCRSHPGLVRLAMNCLSADPTDRPANAGRVAQAVAAARDSRPGWLGGLTALFRR